MDLTPPQEKVIKAWYYGGPGNGNYIDRSDYDDRTINELIQLGLVKMDWVPPLRTFTTPSRLMPGHYLPRLTEAGAVERVRLVPLSKPKYGPSRIREVLRSLFGETYVRPW